MIQTMTPQQFTVRGKTFTSPYTDAQVVNKIIELGQTGRLGRSTDFARSLVMGYRRFKGFTDGQRPYAHEIVMSHEQPQPQTATEPGFKTIFEHLQACRQRRDEGGAGLKNPCVRVGNGDPTIIGGLTLALKLTGKKSKRPNNVSVAQSPRFGEGSFYGYIDSEGNFDGYTKATEEIRALLRRIAADPPRVISELGRETGLCCYCSAPLSQVQSQIAGCGKACATNYGVWYPNANETRLYLVDYPQVLVGATDADRWI